MFETILTNIAGWLGIVGTAFLALVGYIGKKYLVPYLLVAKRREYAVWIAAIADELTDDLRSRYPNSEWVVHIDQAVDKLMQVCDIPKAIARRAANAAVARKK